MVYHNPKEVEHTPSRVVLKLDRSNPLSLRNDELFDWLAENRDEVARAVIRSLKSKTGTSKYQFVTVSKIPFYTEVII
jgi:hypothetical protein